MIMIFFEMIFTSSIILLSFTKKVNFYFILSLINIFILIISIIGICSILQLNEMCLIIFTSFNIFLPGTILCYILSKKIQAYNKLSKVEIFEEFYIYFQNSLCIILINIYIPYLKLNKIFKWYN